MSGDITATEVNRDLQEFKRQVIADRAQARAEMKDGFDRIEKAVNNLTFVAPDLFVADQRRQDERLADVYDDVGDTRSEVGRLKMWLLTQAAGLVTAIVLVVVNSAN